MRQRTVELRYEKDEVISQEFADGGFIDRAGRVVVNLPRIDEKHCLWPPNARIIKSTNREVMPEDEPRILFRARDRLAVQMLEYYRKLCAQDNATNFQLESIDVMIEEFRGYARMHPEKMKQPGITKGK